MNKKKKEKNSKKRRTHHRPVSQSVDMMHFITVVLLSTVYLAQAGDNKQKAIEVMTKCKELTGATEDVEAMFDGIKGAETKEGNCMMACAAKERGVMKDGKLDADQAKELFKKVYADDPEHLKKGIEAIEDCSKIDVTGMDECDAAASYAKCGKKHNFRL